MTTPRRFFATHDEPLITTSEAAAYLHLSVPAFHSLLYRRRQAGRPITTIHVGKSLRFRKSDLQAALTVEQAPAARASGSDGDRASAAHTAAREQVS